MGETHWGARVAHGAIKRTMTSLSNKYDSTTVITILKARKPKRIRSDQTWVYSKTSIGKDDCNVTYRRPRFMRSGGSRALSTRQGRQNICKDPVAAGRKT